MRTYQQPCLPSRTEPQARARAHPGNPASNTLRHSPRRRELDRGFEHNRRRENAGDREGVHVPVRRRNAGSRSQT